MKWFAALLLVASAPAWGVGIIGPCTSSDPAPPMQAASAPTAMPQGYKYSLAACTPPIVGWSNGGAVMGWVCRDGTKVYGNAYAVRHAAITKEMVDSFLAIPFADDPRDATRAHLSRFGNQNFFGMADVWCEPAGTDWRLRWNAAVQTKLDQANAAPQWVATGGAMYRVSGTTRTVIRGARSTEGASCDCSVPIIYAGFYLCPVAGGPSNEVTLCKKLQ